MKRRDFFRNNTLALSGVVLFPLNSILDMGFLEVSKDFISRRPSLEKRTFISSEVEKLILEVKSSIKDKELAWMFENCYPNTLDTTVDHEVIDGRPDTFIITGDIDAMWLRDSTAQIWPYMPLIQKDEKLKNLITGLINRQVKCVLLDPYANAFYKDLSKVSKWNDDIPKTVPGVHERKWEIDSLCYTIRLSDGYFNLTGDTSIFDDSWDKAMRLIVKTFKTEQRKDGSSPYKFIRKTSKMTDAPLFEGTGRPIKYTGLICSMFRPSDDATLYPYLIPSNIFAELSLRQLTKIYSEVLQDAEFAEECNDFANEIKNAIDEYAISEHLDFGKIYAYEVDGYGNKVFMDDANVPSLMSLAYLSNQFQTETTYKNTRSFLISDANPYYLKGKVAEGQGSPHTGKDKIWPMGIILRALTSNDKEEIKECLNMLKSTHAETGFMHEAFHKDDPNDYTRDWFAWANTLFGELIIKLHTDYPELL
ncbi:glycoside hydrolase family 125 protein [Flagellimonas sp. 389]|uniref:glycoside hydrolase family 125 protein n=1 Tax=Flagellimonas sp. 389 TaxID=2835862 RepID=UPI001BD6750F|nr:glycoside hydrolase family 125 protein [Flagellimonas sp. 389]MBS9462571.1 glycoside hydrolase family 125 protein [Flagellimonas sp. 389]